MSEQDQFLKDLATDQDQQTGDVFGATETPEKAEAEPDAEEFDEVGGVKPRNRRERRLLQKLEDEKRSAAFLAGKLEAREEAKSSLSEERDYLKSVERIYGTETPEAQIATDLLKKAMVGLREDAKSMALDELRAERQREREEENSAVSTLESYVEDIEDTYNVTMTEPQERAYFELLRKMSPKDRDGNVTDYADPRAVWEVFQERLSARPGASRAAKELSARSMTPSGASSESTLPDDAAARFLRENNII